MFTLSILDEFIGPNNAHAHLPSQTEAEVRKGKASIKRIAESTEETSQQILAPELRKSQMWLLQIFLFSMHLKERSAMCVREEHTTEFSDS